MTDAATVVVVSSTRYAACVPFTLDVEAGYQDDPRDNGNWTGGDVGVGALIGTNRGVTPIFLAQYRHVRPSTITVDVMKSLTQAEATAAYGALVWNPVQGDRLGAGIDQSVFDMQVNGGTEGARCYQRAVGLTGDDVDGYIGNVSLAHGALVVAADLAKNLERTGYAAMQLQKWLGFTGNDVDGWIGPMSLLALTGAANGRMAALCCTYYERRIDSYMSDRTWDVDGRGWTNRAQECLAVSLKMVGGT